VNGMRSKKLRRDHSAKYTPEGLPRDANAWTVKNWADLARDAARGEESCGTAQIGVSVGVPIERGA
jgi:hypothetical protein